jgi:hypothetical protein
MLNEYLPNKMLMEERVKRDWFLQNVEMDNSWKGGKLIVPFKAAGASSIEFGQLADTTDISQSSYIRGSIDDYVEVWGSCKFLHRDLMDHSGKIPETTFLKLIPDEVENLMDMQKEAVSTNLLIGSHFATFLADGTAGGVIEVDHIDRFQLSQKLSIKDGNSVELTVYVIAIDVNTAASSVPGAGQITVSATRGGAAVSVAAYTTAQSAKCYHPGVLTNGGFTSVKSVLLSLANGGSATVHGKTKLSYPMLQAVNILGSDITASNIVDKIFDGYTKVRSKAKGNANKVVMSFKHLGSVLKVLESQKGPYVVTKNLQASLYGWSEIEITSVKGTLTLVGILEMDDDVIFYLDMKTYKFYSNGGFKKRAAPDGREYFEVRSVSGYAYIVDAALFGELGHLCPGNNGILYSISY